MAFTVLQSFEEVRRREGGGSKYEQLMDGKIYQVPLKEMGHKSERNLGMAIRAYAKRHNRKVRIETGKGYVIMQAKAVPSEADVSA